MLTRDAAGGVSSPLSRVEDTGWPAVKSVPVLVYTFWLRVCLTVDAGEGD